MHGKKQQAGHNPLLKEGPPRRSKIVMLPQVIGAAGVVSHAFSYSLANRFEHGLDFLIKNPVPEPENHNAFRFQPPRSFGLLPSLKVFP